MTVEAQNPNQTAYSSTGPFGWFWSQWTGGWEEGNVSVLANFAKFGLAFCVCNDFLWTNTPLIAQVLFSDINAYEVSGVAAA